MISVTIKSVSNDGKITFGLDDDTYTVIRYPKVKLLDKNGLVVPCVNFNEWFALKTMGFYTVNHLFAMAAAFKDGAATNVDQRQVAKYADDIFDVIKNSLFRDGLVTYYIGQHPKCLWSRKEIERLVFSTGSRSDLVGICNARGYTDLAARLERDGVIGLPAIPIKSDVGDVIIRSRIKKYLDEHRQD